MQQQKQQKQMSFVKSIALAFATVAVSTWALGSLWLHAEAAVGDTPALADASQR